MYRKDFLKAYKSSCVSHDESAHPRKGKIICHKIELASEAYLLSVEKNIMTKPENMGIL